MSLFATESGHWYTRDGEPAYEVEASSGKGLRPTTLRDARKLNLVPSVTSILKVAAKPGLEIWKQTQIIHAALTLPRLPNESEEDFAKRVVQDSQEQAKKAREKGSEIHGYIEHHFKGGSVPAEYKVVVNEVESQLSLLGLKGPWSVEKSFSSPFGYGGKIDLHSDDVVIDFKTKENWTDSTKLAYDEHGMQLAAYSMGACVFPVGRINIFVSTQELGKTHAEVWSDESFDRHWQMFRSLLRYWQISNKMEVES